MTTAFIRFTCPACNKSLRAKSAAAGKRVQCACGHAFVLPGPAEEPPAGPGELPSPCANGILCLSALMLVAAIVSSLLVVLLFSPE